jgi:hypothetical protein
MPGYVAAFDMETEELGNPNFPKSSTNPGIAVPMPFLSKTEARATESAQSSKLALTDVNRYTGGWCWSLAWHLSCLGGWPIVTIGTDSDGIWQHVVVRVGKRYLDAEGLHSKTDLRRKWGAYFNELGIFRDRRTYLRHLFMEYRPSTTANWDYGANHTARVARYIVDRLMPVQARR